MFKHSLGWVLAWASVAWGVCLAEGPKEPAKSGPAAKPATTGGNLMKTGPWEGWDKGFSREGDVLVCDNGKDVKAERGAKQFVVLNQIVPQPVVASVWSKAEGVTGKPDADYSLWLDIGYTDGTFLFGQAVPFNTGTHDWERREVLVVPAKPIKALDFFVLLRRHGGKAWFRGPELYVVKTQQEEETLKELARKLEDLYKLSKEDRTIAVLDLVDKGPSVELAVLRSALAEMLTSDLTQYQGVRVVERLRVEGFLKEASLPDGLLDPATAQRAGNALAARYLLSGAFRGEEKNISVDLSLYEVGRKEPLARWALTRPAGEVLELRRELMEKVLTGLGIREPALRPPPQAQEGPSPTAAVLALRNLSPSKRLDAMEAGFADILQADLGAIKTVRLVDREQLHRVLREQKLSLSGLVDPQTAVRVGKLLGAQRLIYGSFVEVGDKLRLDLRIADTQTAMVLRSETSEGSTADFAGQLEGLAIRVAAALAVRPPQEAAQLVQAATPARKLEGALHMAEAELAFYRGQYEESAKAAERALLVEPKNPLAMLRRVRARFSLREFPAAIEAGEQALASGGLAKGSSVKRNLCETLAYAYYAAEKFDEAAKLAKQMEEEFPPASLADAQLVRPFALFAAGRREEAVTKLEVAVKLARDRGDQAALFDAFVNLLAYYLGEDTVVQASFEFDRKKGDPEYRKIVTRRSRSSAEGVIRAFEIVLEEAPRHMDVWGGFVEGQVFIPVEVRYLDESLWRQYYLTDDQKVQYIRRVLKLFPGSKAVVQRGNERLAQLLKIEQAPEATVAALREALKNVPDPRTDMYPRPSDVWNFAFGGYLDEIMWTRFQLADAGRKLPGGDKTAAEELPRIVADYGVTNSLGVSIAQLMDRLGVELRLPPRAALIWGGGARAQVAWGDVLKPKGFNVHGAGQRTVSAAHLAPYQLVVLARPGMVAYAPVEVLALRHYVATGGSLLVVLSPGWEPSAPSLHNAILSNFGVTAEQDMVIRAESTAISKHAITAGIEKAMAKTAVHLKVPEGTALVRAGDRVVLAAMPYRHGRVVVASFGQWLVPDAHTPVAAVDVQYDPRSYTTPRDKLPLEQGEGLELKLLDNVIAWLAEPHRDGAPLASFRQPFMEAQIVALKAQFRTATREAVSAAMEKLIDSCPPGDWKEEALWAAGEATFNIGYFPAGRMRTPSKGWGRDEEPILPRPDFYQRLIDQFPDSPVRPWAQWRLAEAELDRLIGQYASTREQAQGMKFFEKVQAPDGSYPWAWTQLRLGIAQYQLGDMAKARECFEKVVNRMGAGPEKAMAMLNLGHCCLAAKDRDGAIKYYRMAKSTPNIFFADIQTGPYVNWGPLSERGYTDSSDINDSAYRQLRRMWVLW